MYYLSPSNKPFPIRYDKVEEKDIPKRVIDLTVNEPFGFNVFGHPRSEISFLQENNKSALAEAIANQLRFEKEHPDDLPKGLTADQRMDAMRTRYMQTPSEIAAYVQSAGAVLDAAKSKEEIASDMIEEKVEPSNNEVNE